MIRIYLTLLLLIGCVAGWSQDQQFTQFYASPTHMNPAFAGASVQSRLGLQFRNQWGAIPGGFKAVNLTYDQYMPNLKSGIGFLVEHDRAGSGALRNTSFNFQYAYEAKITRKWFFRPALQFGYVTKNIDFAKLTFYDQMIRDGNVPTLEEPIFKPVNYFDFGAGLLTYGPNFWLGMSASHLNSADESLYANDESILPRHISVHGGLRIRIKGNSLAKLDHHIVLASHFQMMQEFDQMDFGFYYEFSPIVLGLWYRGLPAKANRYGFPNQDAVAVLLGIQASNYKIGYSYDVTISTLGIGSSAGSHEISLVYQWANKHNQRTERRRIMPCAKF